MRAAYSIYDPTKTVFKRDTSIIVCQKVSSDTDAPWHADKRANRIRVFTGARAVSST